MPRVRWGIGVSLLAAGAAWAGDPPGSAAARAAVALCQSAEELTGAERAERLARALSDAEAAVAADEDDALAQFALFCALGGRMQDAGIGLAMLTDLRRLRAAVDRTLELAPDFADALAGKGALLCGLPRLLGGDPTEGERLLRRALEIDADYLGPRFDLVEALSARGETDEARREARRAHTIARRKGSAADLRRAEELLAGLRR